MHLIVEYKTLFIYFRKIISKESDVKKLLNKEGVLDEKMYNQMNEWLNQINNHMNSQIQPTDYEIAFEHTQKLEKRIEDAFANNSSESLSLMIYACCKT